MEIDMNKINEGDSLTLTIPKDVVHWYTKCLVCDESIPVDGPFDCGYKICDNCKRAILKMREHMKED